MPVTSRDLLIAVIFSLTSRLLRIPLLRLAALRARTRRTERCDPLERPTPGRLSPDWGLRPKGMSSMTRPIML